MCVWRSDPDASSFMPPRMDRHDYWTQCIHRQDTEIVGMDTGRFRVWILVENECVSRLHRESQGLVSCLAQLSEAGEFSLETMKE